MNPAPAEAQRHPGIPRLACRTRPPIRLGRGASPARSTSTPCSRPTPAVLYARLREDAGEDAHSCRASSTSTTPTSFLRKPAGQRQHRPRPAPPPSASLRPIRWRTRSTPLTPTRQVSTIYAPNNTYQVILELNPEYMNNPSALSMLYVRLGGRRPRAARRRGEN